MGVRYANIRREDLRNTERDARGFLRPVRESMHARYVPPPPIALTCEQKEVRKSIVSDEIMKMRSILNQSMVADCKAANVVMICGEVKKFPGAKF